jgi:4-hydroxybenzoyl-CoA reductase subunit beta
MLRLPPFDHHSPTSLDEATSLLADLAQKEQSAQVIAGGTDLVPNMKHEITTPQHLVSLRKIKLDGINIKGDSMHIGPMTTLHKIAQNPHVALHFPALAEACARIAGPQLRRMGTLGGNLCLDTRCLYIDQSHFWRSALGFCLKKDGSACHVVAGGKRCVAAASNDSALPLILYGAQVTLAGAKGQRKIALDALYVADGVKNTQLRDDEILCDIEIPRPQPGQQVIFDKLTLRQSIDFPLLNLALSVQRDPKNGLVQSCKAAVGALQANHKILNLDKKTRGRPMNEALGQEVAERLYASCRPLTSLATDPNWRRCMLRVMVRRNWQELMEKTSFSSNPSTWQPIS